MTEQFRHYTDRITLVPFGGHPSIPFKWDIAQRLDKCNLDYNIPIVILYFGDLDDTGIKIYESAIEDINTWSNVDIEFIRCGLTEDQAVKYDIPENFEHPGSYQWEALSDEGAKQIITESVNKYISQDVINRTYEREEGIEEILHDKIEGAIDTIDFNDIQ